MSGTELNVTVDRVVDGDTVRVFLEDGASESESLRILALDTEEVHAGSKPVTPLGRIASDRAKALMAPGDRITLVFPGTEPVAEALARYRGNFGRALVYLRLADGTDFQERMIREGMSPYFMKYGYAHFSAFHARYVAAERAAQTERLGIWDQIAHNGSVLRNYAALSTWWDLRARIIEGYREVKRRAPEVNLFNTRLDYAHLRRLARDGREATVFMELRSFRPAGPHALFSTGSIEQPFGLLVREGNEAGGQPVMRLLQSRYVAEGEAMPRRSYAYVTGPMKQFPDDGGTPEMVITDASQIADGPGAALSRALGGI